VLLGIEALATTDSSQSSTDILDVEEKVRNQSNGGSSASFQDYLATLMTEGFGYEVAIRWLLNSAEVVRFLGPGKPEAQAAVSLLLTRAEDVYQRRRVDSRPRIIAVGEMGGRIEPLHPA
jgi:hypothetical protein